MIYNLFLFFASGGFRRSKNIANYDQGNVEFFLRDGSEHLPGESDPRRRTSYPGASLSTR